MKKKIILFLLFLLIPTLCVAGFNDKIRAVIVAKNATPDGCSTPDNGNTLDEGFPSPTDLTWTDTGSTITIGANLPGTGPTGTWDTCDLGVRFEAANSATWKYHNLGSTVDRTKNITITQIVYMNAATLTAYADNNVFSFGTAANPATNPLVYVRFRYTTGTTYTFWATGSSASSQINVALGTYYKITLTLDGAGAASGSSIDIDSWNGSTWGDVGSATFTRADVADPQYVHVGPYAGVGSGESLDMYVGLLSINAVTP